MTTLRSRCFAVLVGRVAGPSATQDPQRDRRFKKRRELAELDTIWVRLIRDRPEGPEGG
jgi:hypothetical protein